MNNLEQEKFKIKTEKLAEKIKAMSPEEYDKFMKRLIIKIRKIEVDVINTEKKLKYLENVPTQRELTEDKIASIMGITGTAILAMAATMGYFISGEQIDGGIAGAFSGFFAGIIPTWANIVAYENKPLSNILNEVRIKVLKKKLQKLDKQYFDNNHKYSGDFK